MLVSVASVLSTVVLSVATVVLSPTVPALFALFEHAPKTIANPIAVTKSCFFIC